MEIKSLRLKIFKMTILNFEDFMKKYNLKNGTKNESQSQKIFNYSMYPTDSKRYSDKRFINIENGSMGGTHVTFFYIKGNKSYYFDSFEVQSDKFLFNQLPEPIIYHN